jgi:hypothetical protein
MCTGPRYEGKRKSLRVKAGDQLSALEFCKRSETLLRLINKGNSKVLQLGEQEEPYLRYDASI